jgi:flagellar hook-associated protein 2
VSTSSLSLGTGSGGSPISVSGLASGLDTSTIISELMSIERGPVTHLTDEKLKLQGGETVLQNLQSSLQQLSFVVSEFSLPSLFESSQTVTSNEPARVSAVASSGAAIGGYEVEVTALANSAQRTFTFTSPEAEQTITIDGKELTLKAGESAKSFATAVNSDAEASVYAAALENGTVVLSNRATGTTGGEFITVEGAGTTLAEVEGTAKEGKDAEYAVDGVAGTSSSNTVTDAIAGVTLTLGGLTPAGPVTIDVQPPGPSTSAIEAQVQSFIKLYNSTVEAIHQQLTTKPPAKPQSSSELATGTLFGDLELSSLLDSMRAAMYEPIAELESGMSNPYDIGISTGAPTSGTTSQGSLEGLLTLDPAKLGEALQANPAGVQKMLEQWSQSLESQLNNASEAGGSLEARANADASQITQLTSQINNMNEMLALREKALQRTYAELEAVISQNNAKSDWLTQQSESLSKLST